MTSPHKVALVYRLDRPGGVQSVAFALIRGLNRQGIVPDVLWDVPPSRELLKRQGCEAGYQYLHFPIPSTWIDRMPNTLRYLAWVFNTIRAKDLSTRYDFVYIFYNGFLIPPGMPHLRYLSGPPLLPQLEKPAPGLRGLPMKLFQGLYRYVLKPLWPAYEYHRDNQYVINSQFTAQLFFEAHGVQLPVVYPPIDLRDREFEPGDLPHRDSLTFFSRIVDYKRPDMVLRLARYNPSLRCVIMGGVAAHRWPYLRQLQTLSRSMGLANVVFLPNPTDAEVRRELRRTRFYVFPAVNEHFGMTTVEAIASGAIPFVHDSGGQREIVPEDALRFRDETFFEQFEALCALPISALEAMRLRLKKHITQFSEEVQVSRLLSYMNEVLPIEGELEREEKAKKAEIPSRRLIGVGK